MGSGASAEMKEVTQDKSFLEMMVEFTKKATDAVANNTAEALVKELCEKRNETILKLRGDLAKEEKIKATTMLTLLQEQIYTATGLPDNWANEVKYEQTEGGYVASCGEHKIELGTSFPAGLPRLVVTPLTRICRQKIFEAAATGKLCYFYGPAGTGKTETMKDTLRDLGWDLTVFNCSNAGTAEDIKKYIGEGKPIVFDEFNRLSADLQKEFVSLIPKEKPAIGITCNPNYAEATELLEEVKSLCVSQAMEVPDFALIMEIMLFCEGFVEGQAIGGKLVKVMEACKEKLSKQSHYDFGMRKLKMLASICGAAGRMEEYKDENLIVANTVLQSLSDMATVADRELLKDIVKEHFGTEPPTKGDRWAQAAADLGKVTKVRHGALLVNVAKDDQDAACGAAGEAAKAAGAEVVRMKGDMSVSLEELLGKKNEKDEWSDGTFTEALREANEKKAWLVVVCGELTDGAAKFDKMNSLLDNNKKFVLDETGEIIKLVPESKVIFVGKDCETMSPANVSRLSIVSTIEGDRWAQAAAAVGRVTEVRHGSALVNVAKDDQDAACGAAGQAAKAAGAEVVRMKGDMSVSLEELFGKIDKEKNEWSDGTFTEALREANEKKAWLVVVCGELTDGAAKFEEMNSLLDDNKVLALSSGERIRLVPESRVIFVVKDCETMSPANVSRLGIVWSE